MTALVCQRTRTDQLSSIGIPDGKRAMRVPGPLIGQGCVVHIIGTISFQGEPIVALNVIIERIRIVLRQLPGALQPAAWLRVLCRCESRTIHLWARGWITNGRFGVLVATRATTQEAQMPDQERGE